MNLKLYNRVNFWEKHLILRLGMVLLISIIGACSTAPTTQHGTTGANDGIRVGDEGVSIDPFYRVPEDSAHNVSLAPQISSRATSGTVLALLSQAKTEERAGNPERAAAVVERALRIEPHNAQLWYRLALLRLQQGKLNLAKSLADKSTALAPSDVLLKSQNQTIINQVHMLQGR